MSVGDETFKHGVLLTKVKNKPPTWKCETMDDAGNTITAAIQKLPKKLRGWTVLLPKGEAFVFRTRREALRFVSALEVQRAGDEEK